MLYKFRGLGCPESPLILCLAFLMLAPSVYLRQGTDTASDLSGTHGEWKTVLIF